MEPAGVVANQGKSAAHEQAHVEEETASGERAPPPEHESRSEQPQDDSPTNSIDSSEVPPTTSPSDATDTPQIEPWSEPPQDARPGDSSLTAKAAPPLERPPGSPAADRSAKMPPAVAIPPEAKEAADVPSSPHSWTLPRPAPRSAVPYFGHSDVEGEVHFYHTPPRLAYSASSPTALTNPPLEHSYGGASGEPELERRAREMDRRGRELDRRERELERRERELERRQREHEHDKARWMADAARTSPWRAALDALGARVDADLAAERRRATARDAALEQSVMARVEAALERARALYSAAQMSDKEVSDMVESSVGYLMQSDEDIADRVRFQSLLHLSQERLAQEAGLAPAPGSGSLSLAWRIALGPSVVTELRHAKALELLCDRKDHTLDAGTRRIIDSKAAMEYVVEFTSHLRKEGSEMGDHSFAPGRISREAYMESVQRQTNQGNVDFEALSLLVDYICPK